jgi:glycosyltransferase involved in cell wall biosynthesis
MMAHVVHLTSVHPRYDTRIFLKECTSLAQNGRHVSLVVADGKGDEHKNGVHIVDVGASGGRLDRMRHAPGRVLKKALALDADIYHLHDPELLPIGLKLKKCGKKVIFDAHEDVPKQILGKPYLNKPAKVLLSWVLRHFETWACRRFDAVVTATPFIRDKFLSINPRSLDVNNFPMLGELSCDVQPAEKLPQVCYVGGITAIRGIRELVAAMGLVKNRVRLQLVGRFSEAAVSSQVRNIPGWLSVDELGFQGREGVRETMARCIGGLVTFHPLPNHVDAQPNKMFEYMSAGIPVIASNFPLWREIVVGNDCGLCVDPMDPTAIAEAIDYLATHPEEVKRMGDNGKAAVQQRYNWKNEEAKLLALYDELMGVAA